MKRTVLSIVVALLFSQNGFCLLPANGFRSGSLGLARLDSEQLADKLIAESGISQDKELIVEAFENIKAFQASQPTLINVSTKEAGFIVCTGINVGFVILSTEPAICTDLSGRIYTLDISGTGPAVNLTANILVGYVQSQGGGADLSGRFGGRRGPYDVRIEGSVGGAWLLLGARAIYFTGESGSYIGMAGWEVGAGAGGTGDATVALTRVK